ncbi:hypothetical protein IG631_16007 [Alternaria alternata]|nr:hypothetical protein IG631_16007 [Alternaria alternata]
MTCFASSDCGTCDSVFTSERPPSVERWALWCTHDSTFPTVLCPNYGNDKAHRWGGPQVQQSCNSQRLVVHTNTTITRLRTHHNLLFESHLTKVLTLVVVLDRKQAIESSKQRSASPVMSTWARAVPHSLPSAMTNAGALDPRATGMSKSNAVCANVAITSRRVGGVPPRWCSASVVPAPTLSRYA